MLVSLKLRKNIIPKRKANFQNSRRSFIKNISIITSLAAVSGIGVFNLSREAPILKILPDDNFSYPIKKSNTEFKYKKLIDTVLSSYASKNEKMFNNKVKNLDSFMKNCNGTNEKKIIELTKALGNSDVPDSVAIETIYLAIAKVTYDSIKNKDSHNSLNKWNKKFSKYFKKEEATFIAAIKDKKENDYAYIESSRSSDSNEILLGGKDWHRAIDDGQYNASLHISLAYGKTLNALAHLNILPGKLNLKELAAINGAKRHEKLHHPKDLIGDSAEDLASSMLMVKSAIECYKRNINPFEFSSNIGEILRLEENEILDKQVMRDTIKEAHKFAWDNNYKGAFNVSQKVYDRNQQKLKNPEKLHPNEIYLYNKQRFYYNVLLNNEY